MGLLKTAARAAVASSVHGRVQRRQQERWAASSPVIPAQPAPPPPAPLPPQSGAPVDDLLAQLERLGNLRDSGVLTEAEFAAQKARILG